MLNAAIHPEPIEEFQEVFIPRFLYQEFQEVFIPRFLYQETQKNARERGAGAASSFTLIRNVA
jgi:hypothetical protein